MTSPSPQPLNAAEDRALELATNWFVRSRAGLDAAQKAELLSWMKADPQNAAALDIVARSWETSGRAAHSERLAPPLHRARRLRLTGSSDAAPGWRLPGWKPVLATVAACAGVAIATWTSLSFDTTYSTQRGEQVALELPDGSRLKLDAATRVDVHFTPFRRQVRIESGEAEFDVGKDRWRPFRVDARHVQVWDVGTRFTVRQRGSAVRIALIEGRVDLHDPVAGTLRARLVPGQAATVAADGRIAVAGTDLAADLAWKQGDVVLKNTSVADALDEIGTRMPVTFVDPDPALQRFPISGVFHMSDPAGFLNAVASLYPVTWRETAPGRFEIKVSKGAASADN